MECVTPLTLSDLLQSICEDSAVNDFQLFFLTK